MKGVTRTMGGILLFHTGLDRIPAPDIYHGRKNADFAQGFYLSDSEEFSKRWARQRKGCSTWLNRYELDTDGLDVKTFSRDEEWFGYIYSNRSGQQDKLAGYDVIIGPIANDTIYDTWGVTTSGFLKRGQALQLLLIGPQYMQTVIKTEKAAAALRFISADILDSAVISRYRETVREEEKAFQELFGEKLAELTGLSPDEVS